MIQLIESPANFERLVLGCIDAHTWILVGKRILFEKGIRWKALDETYKMYLLCNAQISTFQQEIFHFFSFLRSVADKIGCFWNFSKKCYFGALLGAYFWKFSIAESASKTVNGEKVSTLAGINVNTRCNAKCNVNFVTAMRQKLKVNVLIANIIFLNFSILGSKWLNPIGIFYNLRFKNLKKFLFFRTFLP